MGELFTVVATAKPAEPVPRKLNAETLMRLSVVLWLLYSMLMLLIMLLSDSYRSSILFGQCLAVCLLVVLITELRSTSIPRAVSIIVFYTSCSSFVSIYLSGGMTKAGTLGVISLSGTTALQTAGFSSKKQIIYIVYCMIMVALLAISEVVKLNEGPPPSGAVYLSYIAVCFQLIIGIANSVFDNKDKATDPTMQTNKTDIEEGLSITRHELRSCHNTGTASLAPSAFCKSVRSVGVATREQGAQTNLPDLYSYSVGTTLGMETLGENETPRYRVKRLQDTGLDMNSPRKKTDWMEGGLIGQGAFGKVHVALNVETGELMAVKKITFSMAASITDREKRAAALRNEIDVMKKFDHPHIVKYLFADKKDCTALVFMEYVAGGSIQLLVQNFGSLHESTVVQYTFQLLQGLAYLHENNVLHRDIKCANLLLTVEGSVKLADFGSCKYMSGSNRKLSMHGTPLWMSPEVLRETDDASFASDIWSTGCTVMEMLTAEVPWSHYKSNSVEMLHIICNPSSQLELPPGISFASIKFLKGCLRMEPSQRLSAEQLIAHHYFYEDAEDIAEQMCSRSMVIRANAKKGCMIDTPQGAGGIIDCDSVESTSPLPLNPLDVCSVISGKTGSPIPTPFSPTAVPRKFLSGKDFTRGEGVNWFLSNAPIEKTDNSNLAIQLQHLQGQRATIIGSLLDDTCSEWKEKTSPATLPGLCNFPQSP